MSHSKPEIRINNLITSEINETLAVRESNIPGVWTHHIGTNAPGPRAKTSASAQRLTRSDIRLRPIIFQITSGAQNKIATPMKIPKLMSRASYAFCDFSLLFPLPLTWKASSTNRKTTMGIKKVALKWQGFVNDEFSESERGRIVILTSERL